MLRLLLDEHISPQVAAGLKRRNRSWVVHAITDWERGSLLGQDDFACLLEAAKQGLTLVTYDRRTIPPLLKSWAEAGRAHSGVIFVDEKTIAPSEIGALVWALAELMKKSRNWDWTDRAIFLQR